MDYCIPATQETTVGTSEPAMERKGVLIASGHGLFRAGLRKFLEGSSRLSVIGEVRDLNEMTVLTRQLMPDLLLLALDLPESSDQVLTNLETYPEAVQILIMSEGSKPATAACFGADRIIRSQWESDALVQALHDFLDGKVRNTEKLTVPRAPLPEAEAHTQCESTRIAEFRHSTENRFAPKLGLAAPAPAVDAERSDKLPFGVTPRELQVIGAILEGQTNKDMAETFSISPFTVKHHLTRIFDKVGVFNRLELALFAVNHNLGQHLPKSIGGVKRIA